jgi:HAD superfamily hydrolase (TIGR01484 family)
VTRLLIALDVDGTTVQHDGVTISPRVWAAVWAVHTAGHHVVLATGRSPASTLPVAAALGLAGEFAVCSNGAVTVRLEASAPDRYSVVAGTIFDPRAILEALGRMWPGCAVAIEVPGGRSFRTTPSFPRDELAGDVVVVPWDRLEALVACRLIVHAAQNPAQIAQIADDLGLDSVEETTGATHAVEICPRGMSKASALEVVRVTLGVPAGDTVAVGDHMNDVGMLRWAARGIALAHAPAVVREAAAEVAPSCDNDGLAVVLESLLAAGGVGTASAQVRFRLHEDRGTGDRGARRPARDHRVVATTAEPGPSQMTVGTALDPEFSAYGPGDVEVASR